MSSRSFAFREEAVFLMAHARSSEVVLNDEHRNLPVGGNHQCATNSLPHIHAVAALLTRETKPGAKKDALQRLPIDWRNPRHRLLNANRDFAPLDGNPLRTLPAIAFTALITRFLQHFLERPHVGAGGDKPAHRFIDCAPRIVRRRPRTRNVKRHRVGNVLLAFAPNPNGVVDVHCLHDSTRLHSYQGAFSP